MNTPSLSPAAGKARAGLLFALAAYLCWGLLPLYFTQLAAVNPFEVVAWRILFTLLFCAVLLTATRGWGEVIAVARSPKMLLTIGAAGLVIYINWQTYVIAAATGHIVEAALGYFINPIVTILLGVLLLKEKLRFWQWFALAATGVAVVIIAIGYGTFPWIAIILALCFGFYGFIKKDIGDRVGAATGLFLETLLLAPVAGIILAIVGMQGPFDLFHSDVGTIILIAAAGIVTAVPLLLFAAGARRLPLSTLGFTQYLAPTLMFLLGWLVFDEAMPLARWIGFGIVWFALAILIADIIRERRRTRPGGFA